ncbi:MAG: tyrosine-type recombinase/integrase [Eubacterium sp.]|nr:tyrosine-type recombinase/integrase [Eubacterium sp.]
MNTINTTTINGDMTLNEWMDYLMSSERILSARRNTIRNLKERYKHNIQEILGEKILSKITPLECQEVLNKMYEQGYAATTMSLTRSVMHNIFENALGYNIISINPVTRFVKCPFRPKNTQVVLSMSEHTKLIDYLNNNDFIYACQVRFILQTGLRIGELIALKWEDVDFNKRKIHIRATMEYVPALERFVRSEPKSYSGKRTIDLTTEAINCLQVHYLKDVKFIGTEFGDFVFLNDSGKPIKLTTYDQGLRRLAKRCGIKTFSMHALRRTFATRCAESGMMANILQAVMGHSDISTTLRYYVKATDEQTAIELGRFDDYMKNAIQFPQPFMGARI